MQNNIVQYEAYLKKPGISNEERTSLNNVVWVLKSSALKLPDSQAISN